MPLFSLLVILVEPGINGNLSTGGRHCVKEGAPGLRLRGMTESVISMPLISLFVILEQPEVPGFRLRGMTSSEEVTLISYLISDNNSGAVTNCLTPWEWSSSNTLPSSAHL